MYIVDADADTEDFSEKNIDILQGISDTEDQ